MTSGTPESIQNWVLSGFQNCLDFASISCLEAKAISSSATVTSSGAGQPTCPVRLNQISIEQTDYCQAVLVSYRLTQPELLIMVRAGCYAPRKYVGGVPWPSLRSPKSPACPCDRRPKTSTSRSARTWPSSASTRSGSAACCS